MPINFVAKAAVLSKIASPSQPEEVLYNDLVDAINSSPTKRVEFTVLVGLASVLSFKNPEDYLKKEFFVLFPEVGIFPVNFTPSSKSQYAIVFKYLGLSAFSGTHVVNIIKTGSDIAFERWTRSKTTAEKNGSASALGNFTEHVIEKLLEGLIMTYPDQIFRTTSKEVKSYGDFVVMCLPNNLWLSVKSSYARERLLASGFGNDVIGVGGFSDPRDFSTADKIRNYKKVGFLAIYLPDAPIDEDQKTKGINTYTEVITNQPHVKNINGGAFFRPLSSLEKDLKSLLKKSVSKRFATTY